MNNTIDKNTTKQNCINKALWDSLNHFSGTIDPNIFLTMLFLKYISDLWQAHYDSYIHSYGNKPELIEELMKPEQFVLPKDAGFYALYKHRHQPENGKRIDSALQAIEKANSTKLKDAGRGIFQDISFNTANLGEEKQKDKILCSLLESFARPELDFKQSTLDDSDVIGNAYEYLLKNFAANCGHKVEVFYTPPEINDLLVELLNPLPGDTICDPACGSGSLLIKLGRKVAIRYESREYELYGQEIVGSTWSLAKMNMLLHGEDRHKIEWGDTIINPKLLDKQGGLQQFDIVTASLPFSVNKWSFDDADNDKFNRFKRGIPPKAKGDYAFILHMIETLKPSTGRMAVVVPHGVLFRSGVEGKIRQQLIDENLLAAVIGLPEKLFYGTNIPAAILIFQKQKADDTVLFIEASLEFISVKHQNVLSTENINKIITTYQASKSIEKYAYLASVNEIKENHYNLNIAHYVDTFEEEEIDLIAISTERKQLKMQLGELESEMNSYLADLEIHGYLRK